jgi:ADP-heptose:LPS heptosyltransferase
VGNDSGLAHLAAVVGCPTAALFGPTDPARTAPVGSTVVLRAPVPDGAGKPRRLDLLRPAEVVGAVEALLRQAREPIAASGVCQAPVVDARGAAPSRSSS